jgi:hypothetical protein
VRNHHYVSKTKDSIGSSIRAAHDCVCVGGGGVWGCGLLPCVCEGVRSCVCARPYSSNSSQPSLPSKLTPTAGPALLGRCWRSAMGWEGREPLGRLGYTTPASMFTMALVRQGAPLPVAPYRYTTGCLSQDAQTGGHTRVRRMRFCNAMRGRNRAMVPTANVAAGGGGGGSNTPIHRPHT